MVNSNGNSVSCTISIFYDVKDCFHVGDDAALVRPPIPSTTIPDPLLVHTIDYIKSCHSDPFIFGKIVATHALSGSRSCFQRYYNIRIQILNARVDVFAMNGSPVTALALCTMPLAAEDIVSLTYIPQLLLQRPKGPLFLYRQQIV